MARQGGGRVHESRCSLHVEQYTTCPAHSDSSGPSQEPRAGSVTRIRTMVVLRVPTLEWACAHIVWAPAHPGKVGCLHRADRPEPHVTTWHHDPRRARAAVPGRGASAHASR